MLTKIKIYKIRFVYTVEKLIQLPRFGSPAIRGIFGYALKQANKEAFDELFAKSENGAGQKPYVINFLEKEQLIYLPGDEFTFEITFFGNIINKISLQTFINFENYEVGQHKGKLKFKEAFSINSDTNKQIFSTEQAESYRFNNQLEASNNVQLYFKNPLCIKKVNKASDITFENIIKRIYERLLSLELLTQEDFKELDLEKAKDVIKRQSDFVTYNVKHFSKERKGYIHYEPAFIGSVEFYGNLKPFIKLLQIGELIHIGRGTSSGLGKYTLE